jgi:hypothetical protein
LLVGWAFRKNIEEKINADGTCSDDNLWFFRIGKGIEAPATGRAASDY